MGDYENLDRDLDAYFDEQSQDGVLAYRKREKLVKEFHSKKLFISNPIR